MKGSRYPWPSGCSSLSLSWLRTERSSCLTFFLCWVGCLIQTPHLMVGLPGNLRPLTLAELLYVILWSVSIIRAVFLISDLRNLLRVSLAPQADWVHLPPLSSLSRSVHQLSLSWTLPHFPDRIPCDCCPPHFLLVFLIDSPEHFGSLPHVMSLITELYCVDNCQIFFCLRKKLLREVMKSIIKGCYMNTWHLCEVQAPTREGQ